MTPQDAELAALLRQLTTSRPEIELVSVGHSRDETSRRIAEDFVAAWRDTGREVLTVVDWPETAASWLRPAKRFAAGPPDAWVVAATPLGWTRLVRRLRETAWDPQRTFAFAGLDDPEVGAVSALRAAGTGC